VEGEREGEIEREEAEMKARGRCRRRGDECDHREDDQWCGIAEIDPARVRVLHEAHHRGDGDQEEELEPPLGREHGSAPR